MKDRALQKAVIYCRVSGAKQVREGDGLASQETRCREFAGHRGYDVIEVFRDDISGKNAARPGMKAMLNYIRQHRKTGCVVIIDDISRLARGVKAHMELRAAIALAGGVLESPTVEFGDDADSELQEYILATVAQHQRRKNAEQTTNRMRARAMNGYWVFHAPIGYRYEKVAAHGKMLVPDEPYASIVGEALAGYASGRFETLVEVKRFLESQPAWPKDRRGEVHYERVAELVSRAVYAGRIDHQRWGLNFVEAKHEPLISFEQWQAIQERRLGNAKAPARKNVQDDFPMRGFVTCACCSEPLTACWSTGRSRKYAYYLCDTKGCAEYRKSFRKEKIEGEFDALLTQLQPTPSLFQVAHRMLREFWTAKVHARTSQAKSAQSDLQAIEKKVEQLLDRIVDAGSSAVVSAYEKRIRDLEAQKALLSERIAACGRPMQSFDETYRTAFHFLANPWKLWRSDRLEDRRAVLKLVFAEKLAYARNEGYRTPKISLPFKMIGEIKMLKKEMVPPAGIEPATFGLQNRCSTS
jgi:site-specific DNA recombinase